MSGPAPFHPSKRVYWAGGPVMRMSATAREKLVSHARFIYYYHSLEEQDRHLFLENLKESMIRQGAGTDVASDLAYTLEHYLQVDPEGGATKPNPGFRILGHLKE